MKFSVVNPGGRDRPQSFVNGPGDPGDPVHAPVNFHAYAACLGGYFLRDERDVTEGVALLLLRKRNLRRALSAIKTLRQRGVRVLVSCKETGSHQVADLLGDVTRWELFREICASADAVLTPVSALDDLYRTAGASKIYFVPTPYPMEFPAWDFSIPLEKRRGIFVGTREFGVPTRNHLAAVAIADTISRSISCPIAVVNSEGRRGGMLLKSFQRNNPLFYIVEGPLTYKSYLELMAMHRVVWQLDGSSVPGQVAGDALLCRMPCLGGNSEIEKVAFPEHCAQNTADDLQSQMMKLLSSDTDWLASVETSLGLANRHLSFAVVAAQLQELFCSLK